MGHTRTHTEESTRKNNDKIALDMAAVTRVTFWYTSAVTAGYENH